MTIEPRGNAITNLEKCCPIALTVTDRAPEIMQLAVDLHVHLIEMPSPMGDAPHPADPLSSDVPCEQWPKAVPPKSHCLMAKIDAALEQQVLNIAQRSGKRTYIITTRRITSGDELKHRNGLGGFALDFRFIRARYQRHARSATLV